MFMYKRKSLILKTRRLAFTAAAVAAAYMAAILPASGQIGIGPNPELWSSLYKRKHQRHAAEPTALALDMAFGEGVWSKVHTSTSGAVVDLSRLVRQGFYKLELIQVVMISLEAKVPLREVAAKRKKGAELAELAKEYKLDHDRLYEAALAMEEIVDREYWPRFAGSKRRRMIYD